MGNKKELDEKVDRVINYGSVIANSFNSIERILSSVDKTELPVLIARLEADPKGAVLVKILSLLITNK